MKRFILFLSIILFLLPDVEGQGIDSLKFEKNLITIGETFHVDTRTNGVYKSYSPISEKGFFKDNNDVLHIAFISNYELYYYYSNDNGKTWTGEKIITGQEGNIIKAIICANDESKPFIAFTSNPYVKYANEANGTSTYYRFDCSLVSKEDDSWKIENLYKNVGSYGFIVSDICIDKDKNVNILGDRYGWWTYGGEIWEYTKKVDGSISKLKTIYTYKERYVDFSTGNSEYILHDDNTKDIIFGRSTNKDRIYDGTKLLNEICTIHYDGTTWGAPKQLTTIWHNYAKSLTIDDEGNSYVVTYHKNPKKVKFSKNLNELKDLDLDLSIINENVNAWVTIKYLNDGNLYIILNPHSYPEGTEIRNMYIYVSYDKGETWSDPIAIDKDIYKFGRFAHTNQYSNNIPGADFISISRVSNNNPYGPDSLFFNKALFLNSKLGISRISAKTKSFNIFPNPVNDVISIKYEVDVPTKLDIKIYDIKGKLVLENSYLKHIGSSDININTDFLNSGEFIIQVTENNNNLDRYSTKRFIKR